MKETKFFKKYNLGISAKLGGLFSLSFVIFFAVSAYQSISFRDIIQKSEQLFFGQHAFASIELGVSENGRLIHVLLEEATVNDILYLRSNIVLNSFSIAGGMDALKEGELVDDYTYGLLESNIDNLTASIDRAIDFREGYLLGDYDEDEAERIEREIISDLNLASDRTGNALKAVDEDASRILVELNERMFAIQNTSTLLVVAILTISAILGFVVLVQISTSFKVLISSIKKIDEGDYKQRVDITSKDEFGTLANAFNKMTENIETSQERLEKEVEDKTKELQESKVGLEKEVAARTKELSKAKENLETQVTERTVELERRLGQVEAFNKAAVGREKKMIALKDKIKDLESEIKRLKKEIAGENAKESGGEELEKDA